MGIGLNKKALTMVRCTMVLVASLLMMRIWLAVSHCGASKIKTCNDLKYEFITMFMDCFVEDFVTSSPIKL